MERHGVYLLEISLQETCFMLILLVIIRENNYQFARNLFHVNFFGDYKRK